MPHSIAFLFISKNQSLMGYNTSLIFLYGPSYVTRSTTPRFHFTKVWRSKTPSLLEKLTHSSISYGPKEIPLSGTKSALDHEVIFWFVIIFLLLYTNWIEYLFLTKEKTSAKNSIAHWPKKQLQTFQTSNRIARPIYQADHRTLRLILLVNYFQSLTQHKSKHSFTSIPLLLKITTFLIFQFPIPSPSKCYSFALLPFIYVLYIDSFKYFG